MARGKRRKSTTGSSRKQRRPGRARTRAGWVFGRRASMDIPTASPMVPPAWAWTSTSQVPTTSTASRSTRPRCPSRPPPPPPPRRTKKPRRRRTFRSRTGCTPSTCSSTSWTRRPLCTEQYPSCWGTAGGKPQGYSGSTPRRLSSTYLHRFRPCRCRFSLTTPRAKHTTKQAALGRASGRGGSAREALSTSSCCRGPRPARCSSSTPRLRESRSCPPCSAWVSISADGTIATSRMCYRSTPASRSATSRTT
ncbi:unnamed protein product [Ectocarpus sp. 13 AM-2016]